MESKTLSWHRLSAWTQHPGTDVTVSAKYSEAQVLPSSLILGKLVFDGVYKTGTTGNVDADFITAAIRQIVIQDSIDGLIVDFTNMSYSIGNKILESRLVLQQVKLPNTIVCSEQNKSMMMGNTDYFKTEEDAVQSLLRQFEQ